MTERQFQAAAIQFLKRTLPDDAWFTAIPGGDRRVTTAPGYVPGTPDILIVWEGSPFFIELKTAKGKVEKHQRECHADLASVGARVAVCRSVEEIQQFLSLYFMPLRGRVAA